MVEGKETEPISNKVYTDCSRYVRNLLEHDDDLWDVFHNTEPFTVGLLESLLEKAYLASNNENGIYWEDFSKSKPPLVYEDQKDEVYLVKRYDAEKDSMTLILSTYDLEDWKRSDVRYWARTKHLL